MTEKTYGIGLDVGSTTTKGVMLDSEGQILASHLINTGASAPKAVQQVLDHLSSESGKGLNGCRIIGTGYGRNIVDIAYKTVTEITCHSVGVHSLNPEIRLLIDVGGQDSKVIRVGPKGRPVDFELQEKCSSGTGRFLENMAKAFSMTIDELSDLAMKSSSPSQISNTCTVFAESEAIGRIGAGAEPADIAAGLHYAMATKVTSLAKRVGIAEPVGLTGGVARNVAFRKVLSETLGVSLWVPREPQLSGALGAAILALQGEETSL
ncbi:MAG: acyl-CoA dehydratase activase [Candidatus Thorarchaeota archaeon]